MTAPADAPIRRARREDAAVVGTLMREFNLEFGEPSPPAAELGARVMGLPETAVLLAGDPPHGIAVLRFRPAIWSDALECYLAELYIAPPLRGKGGGEALLRSAMALAREQGADHIDLNTSTDDLAACALYERLGFTNREGGEDGPAMLYYERAL